jgi:hypothetical protein
MLTAWRIRNLANQITGTSGFVDAGNDNLNAILSDLCQEQDLALARQIFTFNFDPSLSTLFGSGPYPLPLDYLRSSGTSGAEGVTSAAWYLYPAPAFPSGQPMPLVPMDLGRFDMLPQLPSHSTPSRIATDMGGPLTSRIVIATSAVTVAGSTSATVADPTGLYDGLSAAGEGIVPGTTISGVALPSGVITLSKPATLTNPIASVFFGIPPVCYVYPAPLSNWPAFIRYQRMMPPITNVSQIPWFPNEGYLIDELAARQAEIAGDSRADQFYARAARRLGKYLGLSDDKTNRAQSVQLDAGVYGNPGNYWRLKNTKTAGW